MLPSQPLCNQNHQPNTQWSVLNDSGIFRASSKEEDDPCCRRVKGSWPCGTPLHTMVPRNCLVTSSSGAGANCWHTSCVVVLLVFCVQVWHVFRASCFFAFLLSMVCVGVAFDFCWHCVKLCFHEYVCWLYSMLSNMCSPFPFL